MGVLDVLGGATAIAQLSKLPLAKKAVRGVKRLTYGQPTRRVHVRHRRRRK